MVGTSLPQDLSTAYSTVQETDLATRSVDHAKPRAPAPLRTERDIMGSQPTKYQGAVLLCGLMLGLRKEADLCFALILLKRFSVFLIILIVREHVFIF